MRGSIRAGDIIDARDTEQNWYLSTVLDTREDFGEVRVHFNGWSSDWDEWIPVGSERLAARGSRSGGATGPDMEHDQAARSALAGAFPGSASKFAPSATSYAFDALMQPREVRPKPARNPAAAAAAAPAAAAASSSSFSFTFGVVPAGGFNFAPPPALPAPEEDPFGTFGEAPPTALTAATAVVSVTAASPVVPTSNPTGFAVRKKHEAVPLYVSASAMAPVSPPAPSFLDAPSFVRTSQQSLLSRVMLARLVHATERASSGFASADRFKEGLEIVHRILTGEARPAPQQRSAGVAFGGVSATFGGEAFVLPNELSPPPAAAATSAGTTSSSSFEIVNAPTPVGAAGIAASSPNASALPALSFFDSSRTTVLQRLIQFYSILDDRELRVGFMAYLPLIRSRLIGSPDSNNLGERPYDVDHADSAGRTTLHWIAMAPMTPRPGGFLFCMMELLLSLGANPSALTNAGESCMQLLVQNAQGSFDLVAPLITLLRKHGAVMTETDEQRNTILHRILSGGRISLGLLEECILSALTGGFDLFAANSAGQTVFSLVRLQQSLRPHDPEIRLALEMLGAFAEQWMWEVAPWVRNSLENQGIDRDCAAIIEQYVSGSGKPFDTSDTDPSGAGSQQLLKPLKLKHWQDFAVGDLVDALDTANKCQSHPICTAARSLALILLPWRRSLALCSAHPTVALPSFSSSVLCPWSGYESTVIGVRADAVQIHYNGQRTLGTQIAHVRVPRAHGSSFAFCWRSCFLSRCVWCCWLAQAGAVAGTSGFRGAHRAWRSAAHTCTQSFLRAVWCQRWLHKDEAKSETPQALPCCDLRDPATAFSLYSVDFNHPAACIHAYPHTLAASDRNDLCILLCDLFVIVLFRPSFTHFLQTPQILLKLRI